MGSEEVGVLRDLGKQSVWLLRRISAGEIIGGAPDEPEADAGEDNEEEEEEEEEEAEAGADFQDVADVDDGYTPGIDPVTTAGLGNADNSRAHPIATISDTDLAKAKQRILNSLSTDQAQTYSTDANASSEDGIHSPTRTHPIKGLEADSEGGSEDEADEKATIHATLDMLVTIIGEFYGQRDLLDGRLLWDEML